MVELRMCSNTRSLLAEKDRQIKKLLSEIERLSEPKSTNVPNEFGIADKEISTEHSSRLLKKYHE